jgi:hypothetical protein
MLKYMREAIIAAETVDVFLYHLKHSKSAMLQRIGGKFQYLTPHLDSIIDELESYVTFVKDNKDKC